ncbi:hypothetical protein [Blastococcus sp. CT_GayMR16]|uniref:phage portal protein family protein n=1 Tax=Blastococcus sp. CT_GayMR16 TaxID=2559607 RepID=UPI0010748108|nr:hypothetical protein [Blastococcus sp. CT_GayMR16]TFV83150.1 hypothetical protein E4P38_21070 [Blastococcus sp. CT_GayMR16]
MTSPQRIRTVAGQRRHTTTAPTAETTPGSPATALPLREIGNAGVGTFWQDLADEQVPELQWPLSIGVYDRMLKDAQVLSVYQAITGPVMAASWRLDPNGARDEVVQLVADDVNLPIKGTDAQPDRPRTRDRFSWAQHLEWALLKVAYGHMPFEQVARIDENGMARLRKLAPRWPKTLTAINTAPDGGLVSIEQQPLMGALSGVGVPPIPVSRLVMYSHRRQADWRGQSMFRAMYKHWLLKDGALRGWSQMLDRNGMGIPFYEGAPGEADLSAGRKMASDLRAGNRAGGAFPNKGAMRLVGVTGTLPDHDKFVRYQDELIAKAGLAHLLNLGQAAGTGSWALGTTFFDVLIMSLDRLAGSVADVGTQHVVEDIVDWNWGPEERAPRIVVDTVGKTGAALASALKVLIDAGAIRNDPALEAYVRERLDLPAAAPRQPFNSEQEDA